MTSTSYIADNWYWMVAAGASGALLLWQQVKEGATAGGLSPAMAVQLINKERAQVIDVCEPAEFAAAHVAGAKNIPLGDIASGKGLPGNKKLPLVVVCAAGSRSAKAVAQLKAMGYENAQSLGGGLKAWREANLPIDKA
ncbi:MAG TPA: rhodanese-like domain-containing protein [Aquabacterium sp.]|uniref:rhodanese-like domain-containing protein n=1 Tax=Aquabacterium sp. TaxID=1872578 RepID=UPI002E341AB2|nr:rhodanese-like domain-containing protein [Aquabacterium sp.]HEX5356974.1 rhodanese-like domain-containing protein [Aquabacterium sp.]